MSSWIERLGVNHRAESSVSGSFQLWKLHHDYMRPLSHCFDVVVPETGLLTGEEGIKREQGEELEGFEHFADLSRDDRVARLVVNEFPLHLVEAARQNWGWLFDSCDVGPSSSLGADLDRLMKLDPGLFGHFEEGAVLHLQNLQVDEPYRRHGIGSRLARYAMGLLGRSRFDVAIAEIDPIAAAYPPLFDDDARIAIDREAARGVLGALGFTIFPERPLETVPDEVLAGMPLDELQAFRSARTFYRPILEHDRAAWAHDIS